MSTVLWIVIGAMVLMALAGSRGNSGKASGAWRKAVRIDHPHYYDEDEHECSECGGRFRGKSMVCPRCGARFTGIKENDEEYIEEMLEEEDWDEEEE